MSELVEDVRALIDASGAQQVHLVGHDWGAAVTWAVAAAYPDRLKTMSALSTPHPAALFRSLASPRQTARVWYVCYFQVPRVPEFVLSRRSGDTYVLSRGLQWSHQTRKNSHRDASTMIETGALTATLNWYRAIPLSYRRQAAQPVNVPALYVWSDADTFLGSKAAHGVGRYVTGEYRFEVLNDVSHWMLDEQPDAVAKLLLDWFAGHAGQRRGK